jgi:hypothetical protein
MRDGSDAVAGEIEKTLYAGDNVSLIVNLTATSSIFILPSTVTVSVSVVGAAGGLSRTVTLDVPTVPVSTGTGNGAPPFRVSGPSVGSAPSLPPDWLIPLLSFVPVVGVLSYRWWRTRRWTRR